MFYTPGYVGDCISANVRDYSFIRDYSESPEWRRLQEHKRKGNRYLAADSHPLNRHDVVAAKRWHLPQHELVLPPESSSPIWAVLDALSAGKVNLSGLLSTNDYIEITKKIIAELLPPGSRDKPHFPWSVPEVIDVCSRLNLIEERYKIMDYDQLIVALTEAPVVAVLPWYTDMLDERSFKTRANTPSGDPIGLTAQCITGYTANGLLLTVDTHEFHWPKQQYKIHEDDMVALLSNYGEAYAIVPVPPGKVGIF